MDIYKQRKDTIDAVILDLTMPQMSGQQVLQEMLAINPDVKVIISAGHSNDAMKEGVLAKAKGSVSKPYRLRELAEAVRSVLDS